MTTPTNNIIRQMRSRLGMTQTHFAEHVGRSQNQVSGLENEVDGPPGLATVTGIAAVCGVSVGHFSGGWRILPADYELSSEGDQ